METIKVKLNEKNEAFIKLFGTEYKIVIDNKKGNKNIEEEKAGD